MRAAVFSDRTKSEMSAPRHGGRIKAFAKRYNLDPDNVLDFSANIGSMGPSRSAVDAANAALKQASYYPEDDGRLEQAISSYLNVGTENILTGNGSAELIYHIINHFRPKRVTVATPAFTEYARAAEAAGALVKRIPPTTDLKLDLAALAQAMKSSDMVFIGSPNNPTGELIAPADILKLRAEAPGAIIVIDEAFMDFMPEPEMCSLRRVACRDDRLIVLGSLGKFFSLAGLRVGYLVGSEKLVADISLRRPPWMVNVVAAAAAVASLKDDEFIDEVRRRSVELRSDLRQRLEEFPYLKTYDSRANFLLVKIVDRSLPAAKLQERLAPDGILIRTLEDCDHIDPYHFRISVRKQNENEYLIGSLKKVFA